MTRLFKVRLFLVALAVTLAGCATQRADRVYVETLIAPKSGFASRSLAVEDFYIDGDDGEVGRAFADFARDELLKSRFAGAVVRVGRGNGQGKYDLRMSGKIERFFDGGRTGESRVSITVLLTDDQGGNVLYQLKGRAQSSPTPPADRILTVDKGDESTGPRKLGARLIEAIVSQIEG